MKIEFELSDFPGGGYYNPEVVKCPVYKAKLPRGWLWLQDSDEFHYTVSVGASSDFSFSGCFYNCSKVKTIEDAMKALKVLIPYHFSCNHSSIREYHKTLK